ncbi:response regulator transcription factor [Parapedobacter tibetensis]|uniref:response regulator transcription factor n=1 Tax=Parapedobacter tibetensis TaxID=2972951 RepID=UPI00214D170C|nr:response regulator transcription factor [Parapedobacter tibetensis]
MPSHVTIADDHGAVRVGLKYMILDWMPGTRISYAEDMTELIALLGEVPIDLVVLDINIPGGNNFQMVKNIKNKQPKTRILIFSAYDEMLYALRYLDAGADGYLQKSGKDEDFKEALNTVFKGSKYISASIRDYLLQHRLVGGKFAVNPLGELTDREIEVCQSLIQGKGISEIANEMTLHVSTIGTFKNHIFKKLAVRNLAELIDTFKMYNDRET